MKFLPSRRRLSEEVKRTSSVLDDYANVLSRDSSFLASNGDTATVATNSSAATSLSESVHASLCSSSTTTPRPSIVSLATIGCFHRQEVGLGSLLGKGRFSKVYAVTYIDLGDLSDHGIMESTAESEVYDASESARAAMSKNAREGKYAMKRLRKKLLRRPRDFTRAAANLVIEAQYLSKLDHPNILKLRGSALGGASSFQSGQYDGYFLILDRVNETLHERIHKTYAARRDPKVMDVPAEPEKDLLYQKAHYALQLASALCYLHDRRIVFRDIAPGNLGFTQSHSLQLFDFGMARELPPALGLSNELYHMTQNTGSLPYKAIEVATNGLYNLKADVFSWSIVVWELMMEQIPFAHLAGKAKKPFANRDFVQAVYIEGERPSFEVEAGRTLQAPPQNIQDLLSECWQADVFKRPTMDDVFGQLRTILETLPHSTKSRELADALPPAPKVSGMVLDSQKARRSFADLSDLSNRL
eukprot:Sro134_g063600.2  (473) ;mRNA; f:99627-101045